MESMESGNIAIELPQSGQVSIIICDLLLVVDFSAVATCFASPTLPVAQP